MSHFLFFLIIVSIFGTVGLMALMYSFDLDWQELADEKVRAWDVFAYGQINEGEDLFFKNFQMVNAGELDFSYSFTQVKDRTAFEVLYVWYKYIDEGEINQVDVQKVQAFTVMSEKRIFFYSISHETVKHELKHVDCNLAFEDHKGLTQLEFCHYTVELEFTAQASHDVAPTPEPPAITQKLEYTKLFPHSFG